MIPPSALAVVESVESGGGVLSLCTPAEISELTAEGSTGPER